MKRREMRRTGGLFSTSAFPAPSMTLVSKTSRKSTRRAGALFAFSAVGLAALFIPTHAQAATSAARPLVGTPAAAYSASADVSLVRANVSLTAALSVADLDLTHSKADVSTATSPRSSASSFNTGTLGLLGAPPAIDLSTVLSRAAQTAPPEAAAADEHTLIPLPITPLLDAGVSNASARARWAGDTACSSADQPVARGFQDVAHLTVLQTGLDPALDTTLIGVNNSQQGASYTTGTISLPATGGPNDQRAVVAETTTKLAGLDVLTLPGMAPLVHVNAVGPYTATASATGLPGGATTSNADPVVTVDIAGGGVLNLLAGQSPLDIDLSTPTGIPTLDDLLSALAPLLDPLADVVSIEVPPVVRTASQDGTTATISGSLLRVTVLAALGTPLASVDLGPFRATATAPLGGLECSANNPLSVLKKSSTGTVAPGESFNYGIAVSNTSTTCDLTNVDVTDVISAPKGAKVTATNPAIDLSKVTTVPAADGAADTRDKITVPFGDIGTIAKNGGSKQLTITIKTPLDAKIDQVFDDTVTAKGTCDGINFTTPFTLNGIPKVVAGKTPVTGIDTGFTLAGSAALLLAFIGFRRLRRA
jgi:uncharacterized repeat protein (TIGR01451 family)